MKDYIIEIIITQTIAVVGAGVAFIKNLYSAIQAEKEKNALQNFEIETLKVKISEMKLYQAESGKKIESLTDAISDFNSTLNTFITETRLHRQSMQKIIEKHEEKMVDYDKGIQEFFRKNPNL